MEVLVSHGPLQTSAGLVDSCFGRFVLLPYNQLDFPKAPVDDDCFEGVLSAYEAVLRLLGQ